MKKVLFNYLLVLAFIAFNTSAFAQQPTVPASNVITVGKTTLLFLLTGLLEMGRTELLPVHLQPALLYLQMEMHIPKIQHLDREVI
jgi:hypothetical protein